MVYDLIKPTWSTILVHKTAQLHEGTIHTCSTVEQIVKHLVVFTLSHTSWLYGWLHVECTCNNP